MIRHSMVLAVVLELLGRHGGAEEVLQVLEDVLLGRREGARLRGLLEACHAYVDTVEEGGLVLVRWALVCFLAIHDHFLLSPPIFSSYDF